MQNSNSNQDKKKIKNSGSTGAADRKQGSKQYTNDRNQIAGADNVKPNPNQGLQGQKEQNKGELTGNDTGANPT